MSRIIEGKAEWHIIKQEFPSEVDLKKVMWIESSHVIFAISTDGRLFRSELGSNAWSEVSRLQNTSFVDAAFITESIGVAIGREIGPLSNTGAEYCLLVTHDGGISWTPSFTTRSHVLMRLAINQGLLIVVGGTWNFGSMPDTTHFVLRSVDIGNSWEDISSRLNGVAPRAKHEQIADYSTGVKIDINGKFYVLSNEGRVFLGSSGTSTFQLVAEFLERRPQTGFYQLRVTNNGSIWASGGAASIEGCWGSIAGTSKDSTMAYWLDRHYFSDIFVNSDNSIIAVGSAQHPDTFGGDNDKNTGVVLISENRGEEWSVVYSSDRPSEFTSIVQLSNSDYLVVGTRSEVVILRRKS